MSKREPPRRVAPPELRSVASGIYGLVVCAATLAAASASGRIRFVAVSVLVTVFVYWAAESYAHLLARRLVKRAALSRHDFEEVFAQGWPLVTASYLPLAALVLISALGGSVAVSINTALAVATLLLVAAGWTVSRASGVRGGRLWVSTAISAGFGLVMIALKNLLH